MSSIALKKELIVSSAPHCHSGAKISKIMYTFVIALIPAAAFSISVFGMDALRVITLAISSSMLSEWIIQKLFKRPVTVHDGSALVTGLLFALIIPPSVPWWLVVTGCVVSMFIGKHIYGGLGCNPFNPVLVGLAIVSMSWGSYFDFTFAMANYDLSYSYVYPLSLLKSSGAGAVGDYKYLDLFLGRQSGGIGAAAAFLILAGGLFAIIRGAISWRIPLFFIIGASAGAWIFWNSDSAKYADPMFHLLTGNLLIGAFFLATDFSSAPVNRFAQILFGLGCGLFTILFRAWSVYPDAVVYAILIMNILNPLLDKFKPKVPGKEV